MESEWDGSLSVEIGAAGISVFEAGALAPGQVILSVAEAGFPNRMLFNDAPIGLCEMIVFGAENTMAARIVDSEYFPAHPRLPRRQDFLGEILPVSIRIGRIPLDLASAHRLGRNAVVNMDAPPTGPDNASLSIAGIPVATGTIVIMEDRYGIRLDTIHRPFPVVSGVRTTGAVIDPEEPETVLIFDFSRPDRFSRDQIDRLVMIHRLVAGNLQGDIPGLQLYGIDQMTFAEAVNYFTRRGLRETSVLELVRRPSLLREDGGDGSELFLYEPLPCSRPLSAESRAMIEQSLSSRGVFRRSPVFYFSRSATSGDARSGHNGAEISRAISAGWRDLVDFRLRSLEAGEGEIAVPAYEMTVIAEFTDSEGHPLAAVLYPYLTLEPYLAILGQ